MEIPDYFLQKASRIFNDQGPAWVRELPSYLDRCIDMWQLHDCRPITDLSINLVCYAHSRQYGEVVLKIQGPHTERYTEITALQRYNGRHSCRLHAADLSIPAMLLERIQPGTCLRALEDKAEQLRIGVQMLALLPIPIEKDCGLPHYSMLLENVTQKMYAEFHPDQTMQNLLVTAHRFYADIEPEREPLVLLHGDLHHDNILRKGEGAWAVIDPQGVVGAAFLESGRFLQNHVLPEHGSIQPAEVASAIAVVAQSLGQPWQRIAKTLYILHLLSLCWSYEMKDDPQQLEIGKQQCLDLIDLIQRY
jgi:streptomycin 6-kinase